MVDLPVFPAVRTQARMLKEIPQTAEDEGDVRQTQLIPQCIHDLL